MNHFRSRESSERTIDTFMRSYGSERRHTIHHMTSIHTLTIKQDRRSDRHGRVLNPLRIIQRSDKCKSTAFIYTINDLRRWSEIYLCDIHWSINAMSSDINNLQRSHRWYHMTGHHKPISKQRTDRIEWQCTLLTELNRHMMSRHFRILLLHLYDRHICDVCSHRIRDWINDNDTILQSCHERDILSKNPRSR